MTQAFNTTTSMGRLTLNVLLSFAQFEREVTGERIRDKIAASKRKGMWMGGPVPLGYRVDQRKLVVDPVEVETVRHIFRRYLELRSIPALVDDLARTGYRTRERVMASGRIVGKVCFGRGPLGIMLQNPVYIGKVSHKGLVHNGEHEAIIDDDTFAAVQDTVRRNNREKVVGTRTARPSLLTGMLTDPDGRPMSPDRAKKGAKTYCYYATRTKPGEDKTRLWRFPANEIDKVVINAISGHLEKPVTSGTDTSGEWQKLTDLNVGTADKLRNGSTVAQRELVLELAAAVQLREDAVHIRFSTSSNSEATVLTVPAKLVRKGHQLKLVVPSDKRGPDPSADPVLVKLIAQAFAARDYLVEGTQHPCVSGYSRRHLNRLARLAWLAPDIISDILDGRQPPHLTGRYLLRCGDVPFDWSSQRAFLGFA